MEKVLFDDLIQSLDEAVSYSKGDITKGRSKTVTIPDDEVEMDQLIFQQLVKLSIENKVKVIRYASDLLKTTS